MIKWEDPKFALPDFKEKEKGENDVQPVFNIYMYITHIRIYIYIYIWEWPRIDFFERAK